MVVIFPLKKKKKSTYRRSEPASAASKYLLRLLMKRCETLLTSIWSASQCTSSCNEAERTRFLNSEVRHYFRCIFKFICNPAKLIFVLHVCAYWDIRQHHIARGNFVATSNLFTIPLDSQPIDQDIDTVDGNDHAISRRPILELVYYVWRTNFFLTTV